MERSMNSILYVLKKEFKNKWKKAVRKPSFYVYVLILVFYAVMMYQTFRGLVVDGGFGTTQYFLIFRVFITNHLQIS